jgi:L-rhamnose mutarotase
LVEFLELAIRDFSIFLKKEFNILFKYDDNFLDSITNKSISFFENKIDK